MLIGNYIMDNQPLVSVIMPTYNNLTYICEAIDSCLNQTYPNIEIIVIDDGSTDDTHNRLTHIYGDKIRYIYQQNAGAASARNHGIQSAQGEYIKFLDSDDILLPNHIADCVAIFQQATDNVGLVYTRYHFVAPDGITHLNHLQDPPLLSGDVFCDIIKTNGVAILTSATMIKRSVFDTVGYFDTSPELKVGEDWALFIKIASQYHYQSVADVSLLYRWHGDGLSSNPLDMARGRLHVIKGLGNNPRLLDCYTQADYHTLLADRYHVYAMTLWQANQRLDAIQALKQAIDLTVQSRTIRQVYLLMMQVHLPFAVGQLLNQFLKKVR